MSAVPAPAEAVDTGMTSAEFYALRDRDVFPPGRTELLDGRLSFEMPEHLFHAAIIQLLLRALRVFEAEGFFAYAAASVEVDPKNVPEPDVFVNRRDPVSVTLEDGEETSGNVLLAIEVSVNTLTKDRGIKVEKYAQGRIPEYWIVDARARRIEIHRNPVGTAYRTVEVVADDGAIRPLFGLHRELAVAAMPPNA